MRAVLAAVALLGLAACAQSPTVPAASTAPSAAPAPARAPAATFRAVSFQSLTGWTADDPSQALPALKRSCERLMRQGDDAPVGPNGLAGRVRDWREPCARIAALDRPSAADMRRVLETSFRPWAVEDGSDGLFTGYYEPELMGSRRPGPGYPAPLYRRPPDLVMVELGEFRADYRGQRIAGRVANGQLRPYASRAEIDAGALSGRNLELLWLSDPIDSFFLAIQGSGRVKLSDGTMTRVGYEAQNGHAYFAIGRELVRRGAMTTDQVSMQSIRAWLAANPKEAPAVMATNPSYIFFREITGDGPIGSQGVVLTPGRSIAIDPTLAPMGAPIWLEANDASALVGSFQRLMVAQDTGGAIKGAVRGDVFWGSGREPGERAGVMRARGRWFFLLPVGVTPPAPVS
jgi:membrane-bound lytic murein transglycosylase A